MENSYKAGKHLPIKIQTEPKLSFKLTCIYALNITRKRKRVFQKLETYIKYDTNSVLGGDFKIVEDIIKDSACENSRTQHYGLEHIQKIKNNNIIDIWQKEHH